MLFNSPAYLAFLTLAILVFSCARGQKPRLGALLVSSWLFYAAWYPAYLLLFLGCTIFNFQVGIRLGGPGSTPAQGRLLRLAVGLNLGLLAGFKYTGFFFGIARDAADLLAFGSIPLPQAEIFLPLGISFYSFQMIGYLVDVSREEIQPSRDPWEFALFIAFFPQLIAGPIVRGRDFFPQLRNLESPVSSAHRLHGLDLIVVGLFKKVVIADQLAPFVDLVFSQPSELGSGLLLLGIYAYAAQIYCDFSGYTDIGRGSAYLVGIQLPENFDYPYLAVNITDFWRRWHITLSTWLRDYLYIPLGGNRGGSFATYRNMMITMTLGGLWHGAAWTFVAWGFIHGLALGLTRLSHERLGRPASEPLFPGRAYGLLARALTFHLVCLAWIFFRAPSIGDALRYLAGLASLRASSQAATAGMGWTWLAFVAGGLVVVASTHALHAAFAHRIMKHPVAAVLRPLAYAGCLVLISLLASDGNRSFIYFQF